MFTHLRCCVCLNTAIALIQWLTGRKTPSYLLEPCNPFPGHVQQPGGSLQPPPPVQAAPAAVLRLAEGDQAAHQGCAGREGIQGQRQHQTRQPGRKQTCSAQI